jgi:hypothetical protein
MLVSGANQPEFIYYQVDRVSIVVISIILGRINTLLQQPSQA